MDRKILNILTAFVLLLVSCEKDANIPVPKEQPRLVVYSYISPADTVIYVSVTSSQPVFGSNTTDTDAPLTNASVTLITGGSSHALVYDHTTQRYTISTATVGINPGQQYTLQVSAPGYETATASTTVPQAADWQLTATYYSMNEASNGAVYEPAIFRFNTAWKHYHNNDYYRLHQRFFYVDSASGSKIFTSENDDLYSYQQVSGGTIADIVETPSDIYQDVATYPYDYGFHFSLIVSTYDYFKFHESISNYSSGDPFAEPRLVYSNVTNGYGIFAGYIRTDVEVNF